MNEEQTQALANAEEKLKEQKDILASYRDGRRAFQFIKDGIWSMSDDIAGAYIPNSFTTYVEYEEGKPISEISETRLKELETEWNNWLETDYADVVKLARQIFDINQVKVSNALLNHTAAYFSSKANETVDEQGNPLTTVQNSFIQDLQDFFIGGNPRIVGLEEQINKLPLSNEQRYNLIQQFLGVNGLSENTKSVIAMDNLLEYINSPEYNNRFVQILELLSVTDALTLSQWLQKFEGNSETEELNDLIQIYNRLDLGEEELPLIDITDINLADKTQLAISKLSNISILNKIAQYKFDELTRDVIIGREIGYTYSESPLVEIIKAQKYAKKSVRDFLQRMIAKAYAQEFGIGDEFIGPIEKAQELNNLINAINDLPYSEVDKLADQFQLSLHTGPKIKITELLSLLHDGLTNTEKLDKFGYDKDVAKAIDDAFVVIRFMRAHVQAARKRGAGLTNLYGYNSTVNELGPKYDKNHQQLPEIEENVANVILQDIAKLEIELNYYRTIYKLNTTQRLNEQYDIDKRLSATIVTKIRPIIQTLPDDDDDVNLLKSLIDQSLLAQQVNSDYNKQLTTDERYQLFKERVEIEHQLHIVLNKYSDKLDKILNKDNFKLISENNNIIDNSFDNTKFDDKSLFWYFASIAALDPYIFYNEYKPEIDDRYAPIPGQEFSIRSAYSFLINQPVFETYSKQYNKIATEQIKDLILKGDSRVEGLDVEKYPLDNDYAVQAVRTFLVEGIPGAGKSTGYYAILLKMLKKHHPEYLKKVWVVHKTESAAKRLVDDFAKVGVTLDGVETFDKKSFFEKFIGVGNYSQEYNEGTSLVECSESDFVRNPETGIFEYKSTGINASIEKPTLIIFDEVT